MRDRRPPFGTVVGWRQHQPALDAIRAGLRGASALPDGATARVFDYFPDQVYGEASSGQHKGQQNDAWYAGYALPVDAAQTPIVIIVTIEQGGFGAPTAAPAARQILSQSFFGNQPLAIRHLTDPLNVARPPCDRFAAVPATRSARAQADTSAKSGHRTRAVKAPIRLHAGGGICLRRAPTAHRPQQVSWWVVLYGCCSAMRSWRGGSSRRSSSDFPPALAPHGRPAMARARQRRAPARSSRARQGWRADQGRAATRSSISPTR